MDFDAKLGQIFLFFAACRPTLTTHGGSLAESQQLFEDPLHTAISNSQHGATPVFQTKEFGIILKTSTIIFFSFELGKSKIISLSHWTDLTDSLVSADKNFDSEC
jgi:hypothetical protein